MDDILRNRIEGIAKAAKQASAQLALKDGAERNAALTAMANRCWTA